MANFCSYCVGIIGNEDNCEAFSWLLPYMEEPAYEISSEVLSNGQTKLVVLGSCKNGLDAYTRARDGVKPLSADEIEAIGFKGADKYDDYSIRDKSILCDVEVYAVTMGDYDNYQSISEEYYNRGKRSWTYDRSIINELTERLKDEYWTKAVRVRFTDGKSYMYKGNYALGTVVNVEGAKSGMLGMVVGHDHFNDDYHTLYSVSSVLGKIDEPNENHLQILWRSLGKNGKTVVQKLGKKTANPGTFVSAASSKWIEKAFNDKLSWKEYLLWLGEEAEIENFQLTDELEQKIQEQQQAKFEQEQAEKKRLEDNKTQKKAERESTAKKVNVVIKENAEVEYVRPCTVRDLLTAIMQTLSGKIQVDEYLLEVSEESSTGKLATCFSCSIDEDIDTAIPRYLARQNALKAYCWNKRRPLKITVFVREGTLGW